MEQKKISIVIPSYNTPEEHLQVLYRSILAQNYKNFEVIIVDDCSSRDFYDIITDSRFRVVRMEQNGGPARCRNMGATMASGEMIFFTDSDCELPPDTLCAVAEGIKNDPIIMGNTITKAKTAFGKSVAYLGFPGGGLLGFDKVWRVDAQGYTDSISSCNLAVHKDFFLQSGMFDTSFPVAGGEDTYFAKKIVAKNQKIRYNRKQVVYHVERDTLQGFIRWQITRGRGNYHIKKNLGSVGGFYKLRLWSFKNSIIRSGIYAPIVIFLIVLSVVYQKKGYRMEQKRQDS